MLIAIRVSTAEMFREVYTKPIAGTSSKTTPPTKESKISRSANRASIVSDSEASAGESEDDKHEGDPLAQFYEEARAQREEQVGQRSELGLTNSSHVL